MITELQTRQAKRMADLLKELANNWEVDEQLYTYLARAMGTDNGGIVPTRGELEQLGEALDKVANMSIKCECCLKPFKPSHKGKPQHYCKQCSNKARQADFRAKAAK